MPTTLTLEQWNSIGEGIFSGLLGIEMVEVAPERVIARMPIRTNHLAPNYYLHAGSVISLADTTCGYGTMATLPEGAQNFTTIELKANFMGTIRDGAIRCVATLAHAGRTTHVWDAVVSGEADDRKLALFRCTQLLLYPSSKSG